jgi:oligopeptide/dipeptide ABC transporter ATP-binding protein
MSALPDHPRALESEPVRLLELKDVSLSFPVGRGRLQAVRQVSIRINQGAVFALVGESGCGKSSLARVACGMYTPDSGTVLFKGIDVHRATGGDRTAVRRGLQLLFQEPLPSLNPRHTIRRILWEPLHANGMTGRLGSDDARFRAQLEAVGLPGDALDRYPRDFSGGQLQRITLARILLLQPSLIIGDEPVSALDVSVQAQVVHLLERLRVKSSLTYLLISHDLPLVSRIADRIAVMYLGEIVESGPASDVVRAPLHPYTAALRSATPVARRVVQRSSRIVLRGEPASPLAPPAGCAFHTRCPIARPVCAREKPPLDRIQPGRRVACHFPGGLDVNA